MWFEFKWELNFKIDDSFLFSALAYPAIKTFPDHREIFLKKPPKSHMKETARAI